MGFQDLMKTAGTQKVPATHLFLQLLQVPPLKLQLVLQVPDSLKHIGLSFTKRRLPRLEAQPSREAEEDQILSGQPYGHLYMLFPHGHHTLGGPAAVQLAPPPPNSVLSFVTKGGLCLF